MQLTKELAYVLGALRDGSINRYKDKYGKLHHSISFYSKSVKWLKVLQKMFTKIFNITPRLVIYSYTTPYIRIYSKKIAEIFEREFQHPLSKQISWNTPEIIKKTKEKKILRYYIAGFWDAEGGVDINRQQVKFYLSWDGKNCFPLEDIKKILEKFFNISSGKVCRYKNSNGNYPRFVLRISKKDNLKFLRIFPLKNPEKIRKLRLICGV